MKHWRHWKDGGRVLETTLLVACLLAGAAVNYRDRIRGATGIVLPNGSIIFDARRNRAVPLVDQERYLTILRSASTIGS